MNILKSIKHYNPFNDNRLFYFYKFVENPHSLIYVYHNMLVANMKYISLVRSLAFKSKEQHTNRLNIIKSCYALYIPR